MPEHSCDSATDELPSPESGFDFARLPASSTDRMPPIPEADRPAPLVWDEDPVTGFDGHVTLLQHSRDLVGKVLSGADYLVATSRATVTPPASFQFDTWEPLQSGRLAFRSGEPQFSPYWLGRVMASLVDSPSYVPERFTIYYRGIEPLYIEGPAGGIVLTPW